MEQLVEKGKSDCYIRQSEYEKNMKENAIIYGAGKMGVKAYQYAKAGYDIIMFVDKNADGYSEIDGVPICKPDILPQYSEVKIIIAGRFAREMTREALKYGCKNIFYFMENGNTISGNLNTTFEHADFMNQYRTIDLGKFLEDEGVIELRNLTFIPGGSRVLDYAFLRTLIKKFQFKFYLEIGTYIGESIHIVADLCTRCYSLTAAKDDEFSMKNFCKYTNRPDYSERLAFDKNVIHFYGDSKDFNYENITDDIDLYFIDGDHSYKGVYCDTLKCFQHRKENSIVVWHDFKNVLGFMPEVIYAVKDALGDLFDNVYVTDNNLCGIYIPPKYMEHFQMKRHEYSEKRERLYTYDTQLIVKPID